MELTRYVALAFAAAAMLASLYMAGLAGADWMARRTLRGDDAARYAARACEQVAGCVKLAIEPGYDWKNAQRRVIYRVTLKPGVDRERVAGALPDLAGREGGLLGWALRADTRLDMLGAQAAKPPQKPAPKPERSTKKGIR